MAIRPDRFVVDDTRRFFATSCMERGCVVYAPENEDAAYTDEYVVLPRCKPNHYPVGILMNDVVDIDTTRVHINFHRDEVLAGGKVSICTQGQIVTDQCVKVKKRNQKLYVNNTGRFVTMPTKCCPDPVARVVEPTDEDGFTQIMVNFNGI